MSHCSTLSASQGRSWSAASVFTVRPGPTATVSAHRPRATRVRQASPPWAPGPRAPISAPVSNIKALSHRAKAETKAIFSARKRIWGKVMFLHLCVILFTGRGGFPACIIGHMTGGGWSVSSGVCIQGRVCIQEGLNTGGVCIQRGWADLPKIHGILWDTVIKQAVCILLECILVTDCKRKEIFSQVSVCPQSASWLLIHCSALVRAIGMHHTGMLSCFFNVCNLFV